MIGRAGGDELAIGRKRHRRGVILKRIVEFQRPGMQALTAFHLIDAHGVVALGDADLFAVGRKRQPHQVCR